MHNLFIKNSLLLINKTYLQCTINQVTKKLNNMAQMNLLEGIFRFTMPDNSVYSAHWSLNTTAQDIDRKFEVSIFFGGGYEMSYYTDHRMCEKNSQEFIRKFLNIKNSKILSKP